MNINFVINNYLLIWNLLYGPSVSIRTHAFKQKLWLTYKKEYKIIENDNYKILSDIKNFIPDNNTMYALLDGTALFERLEKDANKHRLALLKMWDSNKKKIMINLKDITRMDINEKVNIVVLPSYMDTVIERDDIKSIAWGKKKDTQDEIETLCNMIFTIMKHNSPKYEDELDKKIEISILELAFINELYTRTKDKSNYLTGSKELYELKKDIYPYFLMYLGINLEDTYECMMRDKIAFDIEKYTNEVQLRTLNLYEFIDFVIRNKKRMLRVKKVGLEII